MGDAPPEPAPSAATARSEAATCYLGARRRAIARSAACGGFSTRSPASSAARAQEDVSSAVSLLCRAARSIAGGPPWCSTRTPCSAVLRRRRTSEAADEQRVWRSSSWAAQRKGARNAADFVAASSHHMLGNGRRSWSLWHVAEAIELLRALVKAYLQDAEARLARGWGDEFGLLPAGDGPLAGPSAHAAGRDLLPDVFEPRLLPALARCAPAACERAGDGQADRRSKWLPRGAPPRAGACRGAARGSGTVPWLYLKTGRGRAGAGPPWRACSVAGGRASLRTSAPVRASRTSAGGRRTRSRTPRPRSLRRPALGQSWPAGARRPPAPHGPARREPRLDVSPQTGGGAR